MLLWKIVSFSGMDEMVQTLGNVSVWQSSTRFVHGARRTDCRQVALYKSVAQILHLRPMPNILQG